MCVLTQIYVWAFCFHFICVFFFKHNVVYYFQVSFVLIYVSGQAWPLPRQQKCLFPVGFAAGSRKTPSTLDDPPPQTQVQHLPPLSVSHCFPLFPCSHNSCHMKWTTPSTHTHTYTHPHTLRAKAIMGSSIGYFLFCFFSKMCQTLFLGFSFFSFLFFYSFFFMIGSDPEIWMRSAVTIKQFIFNCLSTLNITQWIRISCTPPMFYMSYL